MNFSALWLGLVCFFLLSLWYRWLLPRAGLTSPEMDAKALMKEARGRAFGVSGFAMAIMVTMLELWPRMEFWPESISPRLFVYFVLLLVALTDTVYVVVRYILLPR